MFQVTLSITRDGTERSSTFAMSDAVSVQGAVHKFLSRVAGDQAVNVASAMARLDGDDITRFTQRRPIVLAAQAWRVEITRA